MLGAPERKFSVKPAIHAPPPKAPEPAAAAAPNTTGTARSDAVPAPGTVPAAAPVVDAGAPPAAAAPPEPSTPGEAAPKLDAAEEAKRLARINRADAKLQAERRAFADQQRQHQGTVQRIAQIEQAARHAQTNPLGFLQQAFGVSPQAVLDSIIKEGAKPEATRAQEKAATEAAELRAKIAQLEQSVQTASQAQAEAATRQQVEAYKAQTIAPVLADASKYELTNRVLGTNAANEIFALQHKRFQVTQAEVQAGRRRAPEILTPAQAADMIEKHLRSQRDLLSGTSVAPAQAPQPTARIEPPAAKPSGSQTPNQAARKGGFRAFPKSMTVKTIR